MSRCEPPGGGEETASFSASRSEGLVRVRVEINQPFRISYSGRLRPLLNHKILDEALLRLRFCSIVANKSNQNLSEKVAD